MSTQNLHFYGEMRKLLSSYPVIYGYAVDSLEKKRVLAVSKFVFAFKR